MEGDLERYKYYHDSQAYCEMIEGIWGCRRGCCIVNSVSKE